MNPGDKMPALDVAKKGGTAMSDGIHVRRLTPLECERAQGFPDNYTKITDKTCDAPRYKQMGNSMAVPVIKWLGERIQMVEDANLK
jgi:DNA (cytosine-5)-methyltransferase 1